MTHSCIIDPLQGIIADGSQEDDTLESAMPILGYQLHYNHFTVSYRDISKSLGWKLVLLFSQSRGKEKMNTYLFKVINCEK
jgi:hypothetical protein